MTAEPDKNSDRRIDRRSPRVFLVGAGPGDPGLITIRGKELLERADVVIYDYLANKKLLQYVDRNAQFIYVGKKGGVHHAHTQEEINRMLVDYGKAGRVVVRLKGGDPFIFGRGGEEIEELVKAGIPFEVVPGVTAATAAATYAGIPITHRKYTSSVAFITGHEDPAKKESRIAWDKLATGVGTIVIYMGIKNLASITEKLIRYGRAPETPVAVVRWASTYEQRTVTGTLADIAEVVVRNKIKPPSMVVIGEVVNLREKINWFENRPLFGRRALVTRTREQASDLVAALEQLGVECLEFPTIAIEPPESYAEVDRALADLAGNDFILFTSANAVKFFFARFFELGMDIRDLKGPLIGVVGKTTAKALAAYCLRPDIVPEEFTGEGLADALEKTGVKGSKILIPRALVAREVLPERLRAAGAEVSVVPVYRNVKPNTILGQNATASLRHLLENREIDFITFTSSSTVTNFLAMLDVQPGEELAGLLGGVTVASIGPVTSATAEKNGIHVDVQPSSYTIPDMVDSIVEFLQTETG